MRISGVALSWGASPVRAALKDMRVLPYCSNAFLDNATDLYVRAVSRYRATEPPPEESILRARSRRESAERLSNLSSSDSAFFLYWDVITRGAMRLGLAMFVGKRKFQVFS